MALFLLKVVKNFGRDKLDLKFIRKVWTKKITISNLNYPVLFLKLISFIFTTCSGAFQSHNHINWPASSQSIKILHN